MALVALPNGGSSGQLCSCSAANTGTACLRRRYFLQLVCAEDISFYTIRAKYNGPLEASDCHIAGVVYD
eukprot:scaffold6495_cov74-Skeletonema_menzelii.AAC.1